MNILHLVLVLLVIAAAVIFYKTNRPGKLDIEDRRKANANARYSANRDQYLEKLSDNHWGGKVKRISHLDHEDQYNLLAAVVRWVDMTETNYLNYNDIGKYVRCEHGQLIQILHHVGAQAAKEKASHEELQETTVETIYSWLLSYKG